MCVFFILCARFNDGSIPNGADFCFRQMRKYAFTDSCAVHRRAKANEGRHMDNTFSTIDYCVKKQIAVIPGCVTPSELMEAVSSGIDVVKFFPAEQCGGVATITALSAPFPQMMFIPTGGINISNIGDYLSAQRVIACGGSWMVKKTLINTGRFDEIQRLTKETVMKVSEERGK